MQTAQKLLINQSLYGNLSQKKKFLPCCLDLCPSASPVAPCSVVDYGLHLVFPLPPRELFTITPAAWNLEVYEIVKEIFLVLHVLFKLCFSDYVSAVKGFLSNTVTVNKTCYLPNPFRQSVGGRECSRNVEEGRCKAR